jgi:hypothetical protein
MSLESNETDRQLVSQWVTSVVNVESKSEENLAYLNSILGPIGENQLSKYGKLETQSSRDSTWMAAAASNHNNNNNNNNNNAGLFEHEIIFKINERVFIEEVNIYEKACGDSSLLKIEALKLNESAADQHSWFVMWQTDKQLECTDKQRVFKPIIMPTPFKTDKIKLSISGSLRLIDAIGKLSSNFIYMSAES